MNKELLAKRLQANTSKHLNAQKTFIRDVKELSLNLAIAEIHLSPNQPRQIFHQEELQELANSIQEIGLVQPITVRRLANGFQLVAGERRLRAHQLLNKKYIEAIIIDVSDSEAALLTLAENLKRQDLTDYEIYIGLSALDDDLKKNKKKLAQSLGLIREDMYKYLSYEKLPQELLDDLNLQPALMARTAATAVKKFLSDHQHQAAQAHTVILQAWQKLKNANLEQTKLVAFAEKLLRDGNTKKEPARAITHKLNHHGQAVGKISYDQQTLKVSLKLTEFSDQDLLQVEAFVNALLDQKV